MKQYILKSAVVAEIECLRKNQRLDDRHGQGVLDGLHAIERFLDTLEVKEVNEKSETACRSKIIKVKCISPFDETWEKGKVYTGEKWHHGDLDMDFWDIYYDYGSNPKYVQFSSFEILEKEFVVLKNDTLEVKEVDINKEISQFIDANFENATIGHKLSLRRVAKHFFELGVSVGNKA